MQYMILGNCTVDNNISTSRSQKEKLRELMVSDFKTLTEWFPDNYMIINPDKYSYMSPGENNDMMLSANEFNLKNYPGIKCY